MVKLNTPLRVAGIVAGAAYAATQAGEHFHEHHPKPPTSVTIIASTSATGSAVLMNTVTFDIVEVTPPDRRGTFDLA